MARKVIDRNKKESKGWDFNSPASWIIAAIILIHLIIAVVWWDLYKFLWGRFVFFWLGHVLIALYILMLRREEKTSKKDRMVRGALITLTVVWGIASIYTIVTTPDAKRVKDSVAASVNTPSKITLPDPPHKENDVLPTPQTNATVVTKADEPTKFTTTDTLPVKVVMERDWQAALWYDTAQVVEITTWEGSRRVQLLRPKPGGKSGDVTVQIYPCTKADPCTL